MKKRRLCDVLFSSMVLLVSVFVYCSHVGSCCQFDNIVSNNIVTTFVNYSSKHKRDMNKMDISTDYKPIRIHIYYGTLDHGMISDQTTRLFSIIEKARNKISQLLSVKQVNGPLLLPRVKACDKLWGPHSQNQNKCSSVRHGYIGEFCENKIDFFQIPDSHLAGLYVYNFSDPRPLPSSLPAGNGIQNADYVLYVNAQNTHLCQTQDVVAYASYCILDQNDRPIAGFINFCPFHLKEQHTEREAVTIAVHELFHALGFSYEMFKKFKDCSSSDSIPCTEWKRTITTDRHNINRLSLPTIIKKMQEHFKCNDVDFGAPLETKKNGKVSSHWDPVILHGSIMSPDLGSADFISIDPISAAVFADSGWYQVNFSSVENYYWGKDSGCEFAVTESCDSKHNSYFCNKSDKETKGCDYLHLTETSCRKIGEWKRCGFYKPNITNHCHNFSNKTTSSCFSLRNENQKTTVCGAYQCLDNHRLKILVNDVWLVCSSGTLLEDVQYQGERFTLICPEWKIICSSTLNEKNDLIAQNSGDTAEVEIFFTLSSMDKILQMGTIEELHIAALQNLQSNSKVNIIPIKSSIIRIEDYYILKIDLKSSNAKDTKLLKEFIMNGRFNFLFKSKLEVSANGMRINEALKENDETIEDYILFIILALTVITIMIVVAIVLGYCRYKKWKPPAT